MKYENYERKKVSLVKAIHSKERSTTYKTRRKTKRQNNETESNDNRIIVRDFKT